MKTVFIYALCEPGTRTVRYIGKTIDLKRRFRNHIRESPKYKSYLGHWLRSLAGELPNMVTLCEVPEAEGSAAEIRYIRAARESLGMNLVNATDGGDGASPGQPKSAEHCANIRAAKMGEKNPMFGKRHSDARKARSSSPGERNPQFGKVRPPEHCHRLSMSGEGKHSGNKNGRFGTHVSSETIAAILVHWTPAYRAAASKKMVARWAHRKQLQETQKNYADLVVGEKNYE